MLELTNTQRTATSFFGALVFTALSVAVAVSPAVNAQAVSTTAGQTAQVQQLDETHA